MSVIHALPPLVIATLLLFTAHNALKTAPPSQEPQTAQGLHSERKKIPVLPGLRGFGVTTVAGSGRHLHPPKSRIYRVKTLSDSGRGSLRDCISQRGPRICLFEVSGEIPLRSILRIRHPYLTIAGQSAPKPGITVTLGGLSIETHDVLVQHLAIRPGDRREGVPPRFRDGISIGAPNPNSVYNVVLDHLSLTWAIDENLSTAYDGTRDITIAHSLIAEGLHNSIHPKGPHSKGVMIGNNSQRITLYQNVIAFNEERNPYIKPGSSVEMLNNIVYGWGPRGGWSLCNLSNNDGSRNPVRLTFIGNVYIPGPWSFIAPPIYANVLAPSSRVYVDDNSLMVTTSTSTDPWSIAALDEETFRAEVPPISSEGITPLRSQLVPEQVIASVGSRPSQRSKIDRRIIADIQHRQGSIKDCVLGCPNAAGPMHHSPQRVRILRLPRKPFADSNRDGYTNVENWLHRSADRLELSAPSP
jgi:hypothetical protein